jgi:succinate dehydrogenase / fumarate reductase cytochrome b subunit
MPVRARPLSPHLQIYRWQMGNTLSILHRATGAALSLGVVALAYWLLSLAGGAAAYREAAQVFANPLVMLAMIGWTFAFFYHFLNGIRHLFWDVGVGFERAQSRTSGWAVVIGALVLGLCVCALIWHHARSPGITVGLS